MYVQCVQYITTAVAAAGTWLVTSSPGYTLDVYGLTKDQTNKLLEQFAVGRVSSRRENVLYKNCSNLVILHCIKEIRILVFYK